MLCTLSQSIAREHIQAIHAIALLVLIILFYFFLPNRKTCTSFSVLFLFTEVIMIGMAIYLLVGLQVIQLESTWTRD